LPNIIHELRSGGQADIKVLGQPPTQDTSSDGVYIAYQVLGDGPLDLVLVPGFASHLDAAWEIPANARFLRRLASFSRLICFDKRGTGLSDRSSEVFTLERRMDDVRAVMDAAGSEKAALFGVSEGGPMSILFAATYRERVTALVLYGSYAKRAWAEDYPFGWQDPAWDAFFRNVKNSWGAPEGLDLSIWAPSLLADHQARDDFARYLRASVSPGAASALMSMNREIDIRPILPAVRVPTLILHRSGDHNIQVDHARYMAERIDQAKYVELSGEDHLPWVGESDLLLDEVQVFLTGVRRGTDPERVLATLMFTDIVDATARAADLGDKAWRDLLARHYALLRQELKRYRGQEVDTAGDALFATFDGPARAIQCASAMSKAVVRLGLSIRIGLHTGECEVIGDKVTGIAVHIGSRVAGLAGPGEVLVTSTVKDLVAGSGIRFEGRGPHQLKGVPGEWQLYRALR